MSSETEICNMALRKLGLQSIADIDSDLSQRGRDCKLYFDLARDTVLRSVRWNFAAKRRVLTPYTVPTIYENIWEYAYELPADCLNPRGVLMPDSVRPQKAEIVRDTTTTKIILTNIEEAELTYTMVVTDPTWFDVDTTEAIYLRLAVYIGGPLRADPELVIRAENKYAMAIAQAQKLNFKQPSVELETQDPWLDSRKVW